MRYSDPVQQIVYAIQFKGDAATPHATEAGRFQVHSAAASASITNVVNSGGLTGGFDPAYLVEASCDSEVRLTGDSTFSEAGVITFREVHKLHFRSVADGWIESIAGQPGRQGTITYRIEGGEGQFDGATGLIACNFTIGADGAVCDYHLGIIYLR